MSNLFVIDLPNPHDAEDTWKTYECYESKEKAIAAAKYFFGADDEGRIQIVSERPRRRGDEGDQ